MATTSMNELVYSASASYPHTRGWGAFDRMVLWAVSQGTGRSFDEIVQLVPDGVLLYLVRRALESLTEEGLVVQRRTGESPAGARTFRWVYEATDAGLALLASAARKAA